MNLYFNIKSKSFFFCKGLCIVLKALLLSIVVQKLKQKKLLEHCKVNCKTFISTCDQYRQKIMKFKKNFLHDNTSFVRLGVTYPY